MRELIVDNFAGGGGASEGIKRALGREPDIAINHDADALAMHEVNHPATVHIQNNIWRVDPVAKRVAPRVIILENVEEFQDWGPLVDNFPCPERKGQTFQKFVRELKKLGYAVEWREERACNCPDLIAERIAA